MHEDPVDKSVEDRLTKRHRTCDEISRSLEEIGVLFLIVLRKGGTDSVKIELNPTFSLQLISFDIQLCTVYGERIRGFLLRDVYGAQE
jgi:hypothetical protein